eukprot:1475763-Alexandrium_andersonii.AAC.1
MQDGSSSARMPQLEDVEQSEEDPEAGAGNRFGGSAVALDSAIQSLFGTSRGSCVRAVAACVLECVRV